MGNGLVEKHSSGSNKKATISIILGIVAILTGVVFIGAIIGVLAIVFGIIALVHVSEDPSIGGSSKAIVGIITGSIGIFMLIIAVMLVQKIPGLMFKQVEEEVWEMTERRYDERMQEPIGVLKQIHELNQRFHEANGRYLSPGPFIRKGAIFDYSKADSLGFYLQKPISERFDYSLHANGRAAAFPGVSGDEFSLTVDSIYLKQNGEIDIVWK